MRRVAITGIGHTIFGNLSDFDLVDVMAYASADALDDADIRKERKIIDQVIVANMGGGRLNHQAGIASSLVSRLDLEPAMAELVENGPASGGSAIKVGFATIMSGLADVVMVTGGEVMRTVPGWEGTDFVASLLHPEAEYNYGLTLPAFGAMFTRMYMDRYGLTERDLAILAVKDHENGEKNPFAHVRIPCTLEGIFDSPDANVVNNYIAEPLRLYGMCPVSDGAASIIMCATDSQKIKHFSKKKPVFIAGIGAATDTHCVHERKDPLELKAVKQSAEKAYRMAGISAKDVSFAELHDAFIILEIAISEEVGFFERGKAKDAIAKGITRISGKLPINTSGGLKAKGHPLGATGVSQVHELVKQLRGEAEKGRQVKDPKYGMAVNFGGFGNNIVTTICSKE
ncbi:MAG: acetyl-CoA acetyltransferase [Spirochaetes bacterium DG_61]|jgi:acetyl-CoA C-acetyltransferase|nr:MAG: acetyl-CoA acetyltransferase [Spirochaetes bacterium DG_61]